MFFVRRYYKNVMIVKRKIQILYLICFITLLPNMSQSETVRPFAAGERLIYNMSWFGVDIGTGVLEVKSGGTYRGRETFLITSTAQSNDFISLFFPVEDRIESIVDAKEIYSYRIRVRQRHGSRYVHKDILFNQEEHRATLLYKGKIRTFSIPPRVQDSLSSLYFFRTFRDLTPGKPVFIDVHEGKKNWRLQIEILDRERISVPIGTFDTIKIKVKARYEGILMDKGDIYMWVTDDEHKIPIKIKCRISIGPITASLSSSSIPELASLPQLK